MFLKCISLGGVFWNGESRRDKRTLLKSRQTHHLPAILFDHDTDEREIAFLLRKLALHANKLEVELEVHAVAEERLQYYLPRVVVFLRKKKISVPRKIVVLSKERRSVELVKHDENKQAHEKSKQRLRRCGLELVEPRR